MNATSTRRSEYSWHQFRDLLARSAYNQATLAEHLGVHRNWVNARINGREPITDEDALLIVRGLGVGISRLMEEVDPSMLRRWADVLKQTQLYLDDEESEDEDKQWLLRGYRRLLDNALELRALKRAKKARRS